MAVAEKTSIFGRGINSLRDTVGKIQRAGAGVINQIKPYGQGLKPRIGPQSTGYQPRSPFGVGAKPVGTWERGIQSGTRRAQQVWGQKYRDRMNQWMDDYANLLERSRWEQRRLNEMSWQPWKDPRRPLSGGMGPASPTLTPIQGANQAAKEGSRRVGRKVITAGAGKLLGKAVAVVPILGQGIAIATTAYDITATTVEAINEAERRVWESWGLVPPLGDNGTVPGGDTGEELDYPEQPEAPSPEDFPIPKPSPTGYNPEDLELNDFREDWFKAEITVIYRYTATLYNFLSGALVEVYEYDSGRSTGYMWVRGPRQKFYKEEGQFNDFPFYFNSWAAYRRFFIGGSGSRVIHPDRLDTGPLYNDPSPGFRPNLFEEPSKIYLAPSSFFGGGVVEADEYTSGSRRRYTKGNIVVQVKWLSGETEDGGEAPAPIPKRRRREEDDDVADCPNIRPLLLQQTAMIEAKLQQQTADVNNIVAGLQAEINANNGNLINAVNQAEANLGLDLTDVKNRLGPQIPDGISTKVSNHYDEFKNFLGETWDNTRGTWDDFMTKFQEFSEKFDKLMKWLHIDRVLNILIFITTVHNAYMLSANLGQTLISALDTVLTVGANALGLKDVDDAPISTGEIITDTFENILKGILGAENLENMKAEWKKYSRIYQAASHIMWAIQSINNSVLGAVELVSSNVAKIGNALKKWGAVSESAFGWMNPQPWMQNKLFTTLESLEEAGGTVEMVALETMSAQEEIGQLTTQIEDFQKMAAQLDGGEEGTGSPEAQKVKAQEDAAKSGSSSTVE